MMINIASDTSQSILTQYLPGDVQPNAVDIRVDKIFKSTGLFISTEEHKHHRAHREELPTTVIRIGAEEKELVGWTLAPGAYEFVAEGEVQMGPDEAGFVIVRSTLNRNGLFITSGLYDAGYRGVMAGALHVTQEAFIGKGSRVGQFLLFKAESLSLYNGSYGKGKDEHLYNGGQ